ncbi:MAG: hypothetical protein MRJ93_07205 [Nitrososphaeraceae archaeon]|nr:hypothetical protein [Nitrososphaeraceae archaeon]
MIKKTSKQKNSGKEKKVKNNTKNKKKQVSKSNLTSNFPNSHKTKKTKNTTDTKSKINSKGSKSIYVKRSTGREEKFDTDRLTKTVSRAGVSFPVAKDIAKSVTKKITKSVQNKSTGRTTEKKIPTDKKQQQQNQKQKRSSSLVSTKQKTKIKQKNEPEKVIVTASQVRELVQNELNDRNLQDHSPTFSGDTTTSQETPEKITLNDKEPVMDHVAANKNKILYDRSRGKVRS